MSGERGGHGKGPSLPIQRLANSVFRKARTFQSAGPTGKSKSDTLGFEHTCLTFTFGESRASFTF